MSANIKNVVITRAILGQCDVMVDTGPVVCNGLHLRKQIGAVPLLTRERLTVKK